MTITRFALAALAAAVLAGCSTTKLDEKPTVAPVEDRRTDVKPPVTPPAVTPVATVDLGAERLGQVDGKRVIYFDFDSYIVKDEFRPIVDFHAKYLKQIKTLKLSLEGHADDRGSREYNLALGQKRAEAVMQQLSLQGVSAGQAEPVSFGKERPAVQGTGEAVWAKNRRVEVKDK